MRIFRLLILLTAVSCLPVWAQIAPIDVPSTKKSSVDTDSISIDLATDTDGFWVPYPTPNDAIDPAAPRTASNPTTPTPYQPDQNQSSSPDRPPLPPPVVYSDTDQGATVYSSGYYQNYAPIEYGYINGVYYPYPYVYGYGGRYRRGYGYGGYRGEYGGFRGGYGGGYQGGNSGYGGRNGTTRTDQNSSGRSYPIAPAHH